MGNVALTVANTIIDKDLLLEIFYSIINEKDQNEALKLKIVNALMKVTEKDKVEFNQGIDSYYCFL